MKNTNPIKLVLVLIALNLCVFISSDLSAQNLELIFSEKEKIEKDLWKKERLNYYLDSREVNEDYPESFYYRGQEKLEEGLYEEAITDFKKAIISEKLPASSFVNGQEMPSRKTAYVRISVCFEQLNQNDSALFYCEKSIEEDKYFKDSYIQKAYILQDMNKPKEAIAFLDEADEIFPSSKKIYYAKANIYLQQNKVNKTKKYLKKSIEIDPDFERANILLATIYIYDYKIDAAMQILTNAINSGEKPLISLYYRASIYEAKNQLEKAYHDLTRAYYLDTIDNPVKNKLFVMDYYFENYSRANKLVLELWTKNLTRNSIIDPHIFYPQYEIGYFMKYLNDTLARPSEIDTFNLCFYNIAHKKGIVAYRIANEFTDEHPASQFAKRLSLYINWLNNSHYVEYKDVFNLTKDLSNELTAFSVNSDYSEQINDIEQLLSVDSGIVSMYWLKGLLEFMQGDLEGAVNTATEGISIDTSFFEPYQIRSLCHLILKDYPAAIADLARISREDNNFSVFDYPLAFAYFKSGNYNMALEINTKRLNTPFPTTLTLYNQALCYERSNEPDSAIRYYTQVSDRFPFYSEFTSDVVRIYKDKGDYQKALEILKKAYKHAYSDLILIVDIADLYAEMGEFETAISYYKKAYRKDRFYTEAYLGAADCYRKLKAYKSALPLYDDAIGIVPEHAYSYYGKALCFYQLKEYNNSCREAYAATQFNDEFADAYKLLADNYFALGRYASSISMGLKALKYDPGNKAIMYQVAASTLAKGNIEEAARFYERVLATEGEIKSEAYSKAIDTLQFMVSENIQAEGARIVLETVFTDNEH